MAIPGNQYIPAGYQATTHGRVTIFEVAPAALEQVTQNLHHQKLSLKIITATDERQAGGGFKIWYVFGVAGENYFIAPYLCLRDTTEFPSIAPAIHEAWAYERKIMTFFGLKPVGHPHPLPLILHENWPTEAYPLRKDFNWQDRLAAAHGVYEFQKVEGEGIYEIPVGPIHAGIIEPGHFRFSVAGEEIVLLEPRLGYAHKGVEKLFEQLAFTDQIRLSEKISGDSSFSHSLAFCQAVEELGGLKVPQRALYLRVIYAELERLANHFGDFGALMLDAGFNFGGAHGARLREMIMQLNERLSGSRFLRGANRLGGVTKDVSSAEAAALVEALKKIGEDFTEVLAVAEGSASLLNRLKGTGVLPLKEAVEHGVVGIAGKALGLTADTRSNQPYAAYERLYVVEKYPISTGDVYARFMARVQEIFGSLKLLETALMQLPSGAVNLGTAEVTLEKNSVALGLVEGWRGSIVYFITTDASGKVSRVALRDPSFLNWQALGYAGAGNVVPDFPLINKSFNLSYSGNDL